MITKINDLTFRIPIEPHVTQFEVMIAFRALSILGAMYNDGIVHLDELNKDMPDYEAFVQIAKFCGAHHQKIILAGIERKQGLTSAYIEDDAQTHITANEGIKFTIIDDEPTRGFAPKEYSL